MYMNYFCTPVEKQIAFYIRQNKVRPPEMIRGRARSTILLDKFYLAMPLMIPIQLTIFDRFA